MKLNARMLEESDMQGCLFRMSGMAGYDSAKFIKAFMNGDIGASLDKKIHKLQWMGEHYIFDLMNQELSEQLVPGTVFHDDVLFWMGYIYRYWHYYTGESSRQIYRIAPAKIMNINYLNYHTMSCELAIEKLRENNKRRKA